MALSPRKVFAGLVVAGLLALCFHVLPAAAEENPVTILSPADGAKLEAARTYTLEYEVKPVAKAEHVHMFVDGDQTGMARKLKGSFTLGPLKPGARKICVSPVNKAHTPIAAQNCINVMVQ
jgi:hypothetical protein